MGRAFGKAAAALVIAFALEALGPSADATEVVRLSLPVACEPGRTCFVQHYVDVDASPGARDFACGRVTYDGHDGVDIRLLSAAAAAAGVDVLAAADGVVLRARDGMTDAFAREVGRRAITDRECGNGVVVAHAGGLETQYCHLLKGSIAVKAGQPVVRGAPLGRVGYSGLADFAHLHFVVRRAGRVVDPFSGLAGGKDASTGKSCLAAAASAPRHPGSMWAAEVASTLAYRSADVIQTGFSTAIPGWAGLERDHGAVAAATPRGPALVLFVRAINLAEGDIIRFAMVGPEGFKLDYASPPLDRSKAIFVGGAGRRLTAAKWPSGAYQGTVAIQRGGRTIAFAVAEHAMP